MSDTSLNEIKPKLLKLDTPDQEPGLFAKPAPESMLVISSNQSVSPNLTTVTLANNDSRKSSPQNKVHVIPFNISNPKVTTPIKLIKEFNSTSQSTLAGKKLIQVNSFSTNSNTNVATSPIRANNLFITNSEKSPQSNTKILTISNNLNANSNKIQYVKIVNTPSVSSNSTPIKITTISNSNCNSNSNSQVN